MFRSGIVKIFPLLLSIMTSAAAWGDSSALDKRIKAQPQTNSPEEILNRAADRFSNSPDLNQKQKDKLKLIYLSVYHSAKGVGGEIGKAKSLLFETLAKKDYKAKEVEDLKNRIVELDKKRLDLMFEALDDVQAIVGHGKDRHELYKHLFDYEGPQYDDLARERK